MFFIEKAFGLQLLFKLTEPLKKLSFTILFLDISHIKLILAACRINTRISVCRNEHAVFRPESQIERVRLKHHTSQKCAFVLQRKINMPRRMTL